MPELAPVTIIVLFFRLLSILDLVPRSTQENGERMCLSEAADGA